MAISMIFMDYEPRSSIENWASERLRWIDIATHHIDVIGKLGDFRLSFSPKARENGVASRLAPHQIIHL